MLGIGFGELIVIAIILLIAVGPDRMPEMVRKIGQGMRQVRKTTRDLRDTIGIDELLYDQPPRRKPGPEGGRMRLTSVDPEAVVPRAPLDPLAPPPQPPPAPLAPPSPLAPASPPPSPALSSSAADASQEPRAAQSAGTQEQRGRGAS